MSVEQMSFVAADLGASSTRYVSNTGKVHVLPNNMVFIDKDANVDQEPYSNDVESALDVTIECDNGSKHFPARVLIGSMATRYSASSSRPSVMMNKHVQRINYISAVMTVALSKMKYVMSDSVDVYIALPPIEVKTAKDIVAQNLVGNYTVTFHKLNDMQVKFRIDSVSSFEESFMAMLAYFFDMNGQVRDASKRYASGAVLSMDIGASTTDLAVVQNMQYLEKSGKTYKTGCNIAREFLSDYIRAEYGFDVPPEIGDLALAEGRIQMGDTYRDCSEAVEKAKRAFAEQIVEQIQGYFRTVNIPLQTIRAIVVSGGGSMEGSYISEDGKRIATSQPISRFITEELNKVCSGVAVEQFPNNPRLANIMGLFVRANIDMHRKQKMQAEQAVQAEHDTKTDDHVTNEASKPETVEQPTDVHNVDQANTGNTGNETTNREITI